jgi:carboxysome shell carbonic anhydrase
MDTDTDAIRVHVPDREGRFDLERTVDARDAYEATRSLAPDQGRARIEGMVRERAPGEPEDGMVRLVARLLENNLSQIDYVRSVHGGAYPDFGHAERFIGAGIGFEEIQLRNLTYFAYLNTVEEGAADLDVGIKIFKGLNVSRGLPVPVVVRFDYHGQVPGGRERAVEHCERVCRALAGRYPELRAQGLLHTLRTVRDCDAGGRVEVVGSSLEAGPQGAH